jgi:hypothetical protein
MLHHAQGAHPVLACRKRPVQVGRHWHVRSASSAGARPDSSYCRARNAWQLEERTSPAAVSCFLPIDRNTEREGALLCHAVGSHRVLLAGMPLLCGLITNKHDLIWCEQGSKLAAPGAPFGVLAVSHGGTSALVSHV